MLAQSVCGLQRLPATECVNVLPLQNLRKAYQKKMRDYKVALQARGLLHGPIDEKAAYEELASVSKKHGISKWDELKIAAKWPDHIRSKTTVDFCRLAVCRDRVTWEAICKLVMAHRDAALPSSKLNQAAVLINTLSKELQDDEIFSKAVEQLEQLKTRIPIHYRIKLAEKCGVQYRWYPLKYRRDNESVSKSYDFGWETLQLIVSGYPTRWDGARVSTLRTFPPPDVIWIRVTHRLKRDTLQVSKLVDAMMDEDKPLEFIGVNLSQFKTEIGAWKAREYLIEQLLAFAGQDACTHALLAIETRY